MGSNACVTGGLIPAHAGKTSRGRSMALVPTAHPRSRGENEAELSPSSDDSGSSPLTRGKRFLNAEGARDARLIPAHAGKTRFRRQNARDPRAHPRSRGENGLLLADQRVVVGSSPLTRGKRALVSGVWSGVGLIPAHAGKTCPRPSR